MCLFYLKKLLQQQENRTLGIQLKKMEVWHRYLGKRLKIQEYHVMDIKKLYNLSK